MTVLLCIRQGSKINADLEPNIHHQTPMTYGYSHFIHFKTVAKEVEHSSTWIVFPSLLPQFGSAFSLLKKGVSQYLCPYNECTSHWCLVMNFLAQGLYLKSHQKSSAGIRTWFSGDQSSSSTLTESSFIFDPCLIHRSTVMLEYKGSCPNCCLKIRSTQFPRISLYA